MMFMPNQTSSTPVAALCRSSPPRLLASQPHLRLEQFLLEIRHVETGASAGLPPPVSTLKHNTPMSSLSKYRPLSQYHELVVSDRVYVVTLSSTIKMTRGSNEWEVDAPTFRNMEATRARARVVYADDPVGAIDADTADRIKVRYMMDVARNAAQIDATYPDSSRYARRMRVKMTETMTYVERVHCWACDLLKSHATAYERVLLTVE